MALMATNILPTQTYPFGPGSGKTGLRHHLDRLIGRQEGVLEAGDFKVSQRATGATMAVDVAAGDALVKGDDTARQGIYHVCNDAAVTGVAVPGNASGNPRVDQLVLQVRDSSISGASDTPSLDVIVGTPTGGATIDNRLGAAALPNSAIRLGEWVTPSGAAAITTAMLRDRRTFARGLYWRTARTANGGGAADYFTDSGTFVEMDTANLKRRVEIGSNGMLRASFRGRFGNSTDLGYGAFNVSVDGAELADFDRDTVKRGTGGDFQAWTSDRDIPLTPGSHVISPMIKKIGATGTAAFKASTAAPFEMVLEEIARPAADNSGGA